MKLIQSAEKSRLEGYELLGGSWGFGDCYGLSIAFQPYSRDILFKKKVMIDNSNKVKEILCC
jgi:hypothetical protein